jgi:hypothetical protein
MKNTKQIEGRRTLRYDSFDAMLADLDALLLQGEVKALGNWSAAQNIEHVAKGIEAPIQGYPPSFKVPVFFRIVGPMIRGMLIRKGMNPGIKAAGPVAEFFAPSPDATINTSMQRLRDAVAAFKEGTPIPRNPMFGKMDKSEWEQFNCRHAELHFSFIVPA